MATISNTPRPGYVWDSTDNVWYPIGTGPHSHADYITSSSAINPNIVDAKGDIIAATAADTVARLAVGANDTVLTADSSTATGLKWATPAAGGMTLISTTTLTASSHTISSIPATYQNLYLVIRSLRDATDGGDVGLRFNADSTANRHAQVNSNSTGASGGALNSFGRTDINLTTGTDSVSTNSLIILNFYDYANTSTWKIAEQITINPEYATPTSFNLRFAICAYNQTSAISSLQIYSTSSTNLSGTALLYGVK